MRLLAHDGSAAWAPGNNTFHSLAIYWWNSVSPAVWCMPATNPSLFLTFPSPVLRNSSYDSLKDPSTIHRYNSTQYLHMHACLLAAAAAKLLVPPWLT